MSGGSVVMQRRQIMFALVSVLFAGAAPALATVTIEPLQGESPAAGPMPTLAEAQADLDNGRYTWCMQKISRLLGATPPPSPADQCALLSLKGECLLQQREATPAATAFTSASQAATDPADTATAAATGILIQRSSGFTYIPVSGKDHRPLPIIDKKKRHAALAALWADELARVKPLVDAALKKPDIKASLDIAPQVHAVANFELAGAGGTTENAAMFKALGDHAHDLLAARLATWNADADAMSTAALTMVDVPATDTLPAHKKRQGLTADDKAKVAEMAAASGKLPAEVKTIVTTLGAEESLFVPDLAANDALAKRLHNMTLGVFRTVRPVTSPTTRPTPAPAH